MLKIVLINLVVLMTVIFTLSTFFEQFIDDYEFIKIMIAGWIVITVYSLPVVAIYEIIMW